MQIKAGFTLVKPEMLWSRALLQVNQKNQVSRITDSDGIFFGLINHNYSVNKGEQLLALLDYTLLPHPFPSFLAQMYCINPAFDSSPTPFWLFPHTHGSKTSISTCTDGGDSLGFYLQSLSNHSFTLLWNLSSSSLSHHPLQYHTITLLLLHADLKSYSRQAILLSYISRRRFFLFLPTDYPGPSFPSISCPHSKRLTPILVHNPL